jgi:hypothetical protein
MVLARMPFVSAVPALWFMIARMRSIWRIIGKKELTDTMDSTSDLRFPAFQERSTGLIESNLV